MNKMMLTQLLESIISLETGNMKLCGRQKCIDLLATIQEYCKENNLNVSIEQIGDVTSGKLQTEQVMKFYKEFLR